jgi:xylose isomerase
MFAKTDHLLVQYQHECFLREKKIIEPKAYKPKKHYDVDIL